MVGFEASSPDVEKRTEGSPEEDVENKSEGENASSPLLSYKQHLRDVLAITSPIILSEIFQNTLPVIDIAFVGNLPSKDDLAAAALATVWFNLWNSTMVGFMTAIDTFLAQAFGAGELKAYGTWAGTSLGIVMMVTVCVSGLLALCGPAMKLFGQDEALAKAAGEFAYRLIPGLFPYYAFKVLVKYLQSQNIVMPGVWIGVLANGLNILLNWALIYALDIGLNGAPWATTITRFIELGMIAGYLFWNKKTLEATWPTTSRSMWNRKNLRPFWKLAVSGALSLTAEAWSFEITTILAGLLGTIELDAHIITLTIAGFIYLSFPFAVGIAASIRIGQLIGDGRPGDAQRSSTVSFLLASFVQLVLIAILWPCKDLLGSLFSSDEDVANLVAYLIPISCVFMMGDAIQATAGGVMRGLGKQKIVLFLNILAFWILAIPVGSLLTFVGDAGVAGLWWGMVIGIYAATVVGILTLKYRISWQQEAKKALKRLSTLSTRHLEPSVGGIEIRKEGI
jgi:MATE family multidrug resistance protein